MTTVVREHQTCISPSQTNTIYITNRSKSLLIPRKADRHATNLADGRQDFPVLTVQAGCHIARVLLVLVTRIAGVVSEQNEHNKPLAVITAALIYQFLQNADRVHPSANRDIMSIVDVVSMLPNHQMTRTALYRFCGARSLK